jgi:serine/threonine-protein kinase
VTVPPVAGPAKAGHYERDGHFPVGIVLGERYRILGLLGRGGMGEVYRVHDLKLEQQVALKFLPEAAAFNPSLMERFRGEVRIARQISHRNVCRVYDFGEVTAQRSSRWSTWMARNDLFFFAVLPAWSA